MNRLQFQIQVALTRIFSNFSLNLYLVPQLITQLINCICAIFVEIRTLQFLCNRLLCNLLCNE